jgi:hypothetical protein
LDVTFVPTEDNADRASLTTENCLPQQSRFAMRGNYSSCTSFMACEYSIRQINNKEKRNVVLHRFE